MRGGMLALRTGHGGTTMRLASNDSRTGWLPVWATAAGGGFCHQTLHYRGTDALVGSVVAFARSGAARGEPTLVMMGAAKLASIAEALADESASGSVELADMDTVGANPARIIPAWRAFVDRQPTGTALRGVGEPIDRRRAGAALDECAEHERLLNVAFDDLGDRPFWLLCPYDVAALDPAVVAGSRHTHPFVLEAGGAGGLVHATSPDYDRPDGTTGTPGAPLPPPPATARHVDVAAGDPAALRQTRVAVEDAGRRYGLGDATWELVLATHEVLTNALLHGRGQVDVALWPEGDTLVCQVAGAGELHDALVGRRAPSPGGPGGRGLWLANQLCDLVQVRQAGSRTVVRLHRRRPG